MKGFLKKSFICWVFIVALCLMGCSEPAKEKVSRFLIKTPLMTITSSDFLEELDLKKAAYPYNIHENPAEYNEMVIHLVKMLSEEIILLSAAADKSVNVTDQEVDSAEEEFKKDYPDDSFDQILLKNAISYSFWKKRFKKNMIIDKLIDQELKKKIEITSRDIVEFYKKHHIADDQDPDNKALVLKKIENEQELVSRLRLQKTQDQYDEWIQQLGKDYPVEINKDKLKTFLLDIEKREGSENATDKSSKN
ncbi:hypothetical protein [Desulfobacula sp.]|uniref:hypothetical protein n=1 Tax=Desulfobacula sp. TaxID=2593537 RepID=UPI002623947E|nr:hypothetical protein [Desulfobacula sp.]